MWRLMKECVQVLLGNISERNLLLWQSHISPICKLSLTNHYVSREETMKSWERSSETYGACSMVEIITKVRPWQTYDWVQRSGRKKCTHRNDSFEVQRIAPVRVSCPFQKKNPAVIYFLYLQARILSQWNPGRKQQAQGKNRKLTKLSDGRKWAWLAMFNRIIFPPNMYEWCGCFPLPHANN